ncbi:MAG: ABC transporter ATP-binding protein [Spirochaetales bacterium]|nr:ABC transporter ATP-binding protein [Spirochaetales bacterium]
MSRKEQKEKNRPVILRLFAMIGPTRFVFVGALIALALSIGAESAGNLIIRHVVDNVIIAKAGLKTFALWAGLFMVMAMVRGILNFLQSLGKSRTSEEIARTIRDRVFDHLQRLSFSYHDTNKTGELIQRSTSDVDTVRRFYADQIPGLANTLFLFLINFAILLTLEWRLALFSVIAIPLIILLSWFFFGKIFSAYDKFQDHEGNMTARIQENLNGIRVVRAFARQDWEKENFRRINQKQLDLGYRLNFWDSFYWPFGHGVCGFQFAATVFVGGVMAIRGTISPGTFIAFSSMINALIWPMQELGRSLKEVSKSYVSFARIAEILDEDQEDLTSAALTRDSNVQGKLEFRDVSFHYVEGVPVLDNISLVCEPGSKIALLGATGSGKTSLVNLLPRFYDYTGGEILLDDKPLTHYSRHFLRQNIGIVEQEPFLFSMTVRENITYSLNREVTQEEVEEVARAAAIHDSIMKFPKGYDTMVGEKGVSLSGGQKQRITIARTLLKNPRILILDDSTSAVDADTEDKIKESLEKLMEKRTTFIIAHRIQTLKKADRIFVLDEGRIVQEGSHEELIGREGFYREVFDLQTRMEQELQDELSAAGAAKVLSHE